MQPSAFRKGLGHEMVQVNPKRIRGRWREGFALDIHTVSSTYIGDNEYGYSMYENKYSEVGELLFRLKYRSDLKVVAEIADVAARFLQKWNLGVDLIVPVPPSKPRAQQPVPILAQALSERSGIPAATNCVSRIKQLPQLKDVKDYKKKVELLRGAHSIDPVLVEGRRILLFDDIYDTGATMEAVADLLYDHGRVAEVYVLTITVRRKRT